MSVAIPELAGASSYAAANRCDVARVLADDAQGSVTLTLDVGTGCTASTGSGRVTHVAVVALDREGKILAQNQRRGVDVTLEQQIEFVRWQEPVDFEVEDALPDNVDRWVVTLEDRRAGAGWFPRTFQGAGTGELGSLAVTTPLTGVEQSASVVTNLLMLDGDQLTEIQQASFPILRPDLLQLASVDAQPPVLSEDRRTISWPAFTSQDVDGAVVTALHERVLDAERVRWTFVVPAAITGFELPSAPALAPFMPSAGGPMTAVVTGVGSQDYSGAETFLEFGLLDFINPHRRTHIAFWSASLATE